MGCHVILCGSNFAASCSVLGNLLPTKLRLILCGSIMDFAVHHAFQVLGCRYLERLVLCSKCDFESAVVIRTSNWRNGTTNSRGHVAQQKALRPVALTGRAPPACISAEEAAKTLQRMKPHPFAVDWGHMIRE